MKVSLRFYDERLKYHFRDLEKMSMKYRNNHEPSDDPIEIENQIQEDFEAIQFAFMDLLEARKIRNSRLATFVDDILKELGTFPERIVGIKISQDRCRFTIYLGEP